MTCRVYAGGKYSRDRDSTEATDQRQRGIEEEMKPATLRETNIQDKLYGYGRMLIDF